jgi:methenyltetrahydromethanopterin cyclohydrolase
LYNVDPSAFSPAQLIVNAEGKVKVFGKLNADALLKSIV